MHPVTFDASRRLRVTTLTTGTAPTAFENGYAYDATGRVLLDPDAPTGNVTLNVNRYDANRNIFTTQTVAATDVRVNGMRYSSGGSLVCADGGTVATVVNGLGFDANGALVTTEL